MNWQKRWASITQDMHTKRAALLQEMIDKRMSRSQAAMVLGKATTSISSMAERYSLDWPLFTDTIRGRKGFSIEEYELYARQGFTKMQTAQAMGVTWNSVDNVARHHKIKFKDGRRKDD
jgi:hypothetical protein